MSCHVLSCLIMSCHVLPWFFTSYHVITCDFLPFCTSFSFQFRKSRIIEFQNAIISQTAFPWAYIFLTTSHFQGFSPGSLGHIVLHARARIVFPGAITWICVLGFPAIEQVHSYCVVLPDMPSLDLWACNFQYAFLGPLGLQFSIPKNEVFHFFLGPYIFSHPRRCYPTCKRYSFFQCLPWALGPAIIPIQETVVIPFIPLGVSSMPDGVSSMPSLQPDVFIFINYLVFP